MAALPAAVRAAIVEDLKAGKSHHSTAKRHGVSQPTVSLIAKREGIPAINNAPKIANRARRTYDLERRLALNDKLFGLIESWADLSPEEFIEAPGEARWANRLTMKDMVMSYAILTDKRRLEDGQATERHEHSDTTTDRLARRMDELAARRRAKGVAPEPATG